MLLQWREADFRPLSSLTQLTFLNLSRHAIGDLGLTFVRQIFILSYCFLLCIHG